MNNDAVAVAEALDVYDNGSGAALVIAETTYRVVSPNAGNPNAKLTVRPDGRTSGLSHRQWADRVKDARKALGSRRSFGDKDSRRWYEAGRLIATGELDDASEAYAQARLNIGDGNRVKRPAAVAREMDADHDFARQVVQRLAPETAATVASTAPIRVASAALPKPATEHQERMAEVARHNDDGKPQEHKTVTALQHLIDAEQMEALVSRLVEQMRAGLMDRMPADVKEEAATQFKRWINALEWAIALIDGGSITDDSLARWLSG